MPMISRKGRRLGKLLLCLQESTDRFGPSIAPRVSELERLYGNIQVFASKSGKLTATLMDQWYEEQLRH